MTFDYIIIGQGISGTFLSYYLEQENKSFLVIDDPIPHSPSRIAAGIINPVTGRRMVSVWMAEEVLPAAWKAFTEIGNKLSIDAITSTTLIDFFPNPFMRESFLKRIEENNHYVHSYPEQNHFNPYFNYEFGCGEIRPVYIANLTALLPAWRNHLATSKKILEEQFDHKLLNVSQESVTYKQITAKSIIFCDGSSGFENPYFSKLPFAPNKGEALIVSIPGLPTNHVYKKSMTLCPLDQKDIFWLGSVYQWEFNSTEPTSEFRKQSELVLKEWLKIPYQVIDHLASVRPATLERRPFVGMHPLYPNIGILNGMGTKGCSLAPFFAKQLADHLVYHMHIIPEASITRFSRVLSIN